MYPRNINKITNAQHSGALEAVNGKHPMMPATIKTAGQRNLVPRTKGFDLEECMRTFNVGSVNRPQVAVKFAHSREIEAT
jgi:hypothetical protein